MGWKWIINTKTVLKNYCDLLLDSILEFARKDREKHEKPFSVVSFLCEIRKGHIPNTIITACTKLFCVELSSESVVNVGD
jgi:hypothetical protein